MSDAEPPPSAERLFGVPSWRWEALSGMIAVVGVFGTLVTFGLGLREYLERGEAARAAETLKLIDVWEDKGYRRAFIELRDASELFLEQVPPDQVAAAEQDPRLSDNLRNRMLDVIFDETNEDGDRQKFEDVVYYFNRLGLCVQARLCSEETAKVFFDGTLHRFLTHFQPEVDSIRAELGDFGDAMLWLEAKFEED